MLMVAINWGNINYIIKQYSRRDTNRNLLLLKYLLELCIKDNNINNIFINNGSIDFYPLFKYCCSNNYLDVAKLLYENVNKLDIYKNNNKIFKISCKHKNIDIINWLCSLNYYYSYEITEHEEIIPIIKFELDFLYKNNNYTQMLKKLNIIETIEINDKNDCLICQLNNDDLDEESKNTMVKLNCNDDININHCCHVMCLFKWYIKNKNNKTCVYCHKNIKIDKCKIIIEKCNDENILNN